MNFDLAGSDYASSDYASRDYSGADLHPYQYFLFKKEILKFLLFVTESAGTKDELIFLFVKPLDEVIFLLTL